MTTTSTTNLANVLHPAGAVSVAPWYNPDLPVSADHSPGPDSQRYFAGSLRVVKRDVEVLIDGTQHADGTIERSINVMEDGYERLMDLSSDRARQLGQALLAAADEIDGWATR
jgi:hypothetical protein